jgi:hypothetical protein
VTAGDRRPHDVVAPVEGRRQRVDHDRPVARRQAVGVEEQAQPVQLAAVQRRRRVAFVAQRRPQAGGARDVPDRRAGTGEVEVDQRHRLPAGEDHVVEVRVVVADDASAEGGRDGRRPAVLGRVEGRDGIVEAPQQFGDADERLVGKRPGCVRLDRRLPLDVAEHLPPAVVDA